jgi:PAS domain S-box-containing protein
MERVLTVIPGLPPMMPNSAFALLLLGVSAAWGLQQRSGRVQRLLVTFAAIVVLAVSLGTVAEYTLDTQLFLDQLVRIRVGPYYPSPSSPPTAIALALLAAGVLFSDVGYGKRFRPSEWLVLCAALIAITALLGYLYGASPRYRLTGPRIIGVTPTSLRLIRAAGDLLIIGVSFSSAVSLVLISTGLFLGRPDWGTVRIFAGPGPGGLMLRRLTPVAILVPIGFGVIASRLPGTGGAPLVLSGLTDVTTISSLFVMGITALRLDRGHDALENARRRARELINLASDGIFIWDLHGWLTGVNEAGLRLFGYSREELLTNNISDLIPPEDKERLCAYRAWLLEGHTDVSEWTGVRKNGARICIEVSAKILPDGRWQGFVRDITSRKLAEEQIRETQERLDLALKGADLATWDWNVKTGQVIFNPRWAEMRGFRPEEIEPHMDSAMADIHPDDLPAVQKGLDDCFNGILPEYEMTFRISTKNGDWIWVLSRAKVFGRDERGRPTRMAGTVSDVTPRKRAEESLRLSEAAAKQATQARDEVLGIVAHDLRNPLQIISINADCLRRSEPEPASKMAAEMGDAANRMKRLIQDLLDVTSIESGHLSLRPERLYAAEIVSESLDMQTPLTTSASLELRVTIAPGLPDIWADRDRIRQVFENLIGNAIKFTGAGGRITLGAAPRAHDVLFWVADTGPGIAPENLPHVFDRFWQATANARRLGAGLGLPITKGIVEAHGGHIWVQSEPGRGSTFFFSIPRGRPDEERPSHVFH